MNRDDTILRVENLSKSFGKVRAVDGLDFTIREGSATALLGANGAGKTTTIAMLLGLVIPSAGEIDIFGIDVRRNRHAALARMNFSSPYIDLPQRLSVAQNLKVYARLYGIKDIQGRLEQLAGELELEAFFDRPYRTLSAGQKTRVMLAKSLLNEPKLLLLDEPTASLDPDNADRIRRYLAQYQARTGAAMLLASHNMKEVEQLCDQVLMMRGGRIIDRGTPQRLIDAYGRENLEEVFLAIARSADASEAGESRESAA
jgi:ABC-2 type transport system ATP-binding protein